MNMRVFGGWMVALVMLVSTITGAAAQSSDVKKVCKEMEGKDFWLKIGVIRIQHPIGGIDATNVYPGGKAIKKHCARMSSA